MARPRAKELTKRELEVMHAFWDHGESTVAAIRDRLADLGRDLAYTTVATLVRILSRDNQSFFRSKSSAAELIAVIPVTNVGRISG
ncbi:MAG: BlaI/MecI/CopY family transcriptional regulator [Planctomycetaceae bacterium]